MTYYKLINVETGEVELHESFPEYPDEYYEPHNFEDLGGIGWEPR